MKIAFGRGFFWGLLALFSHVCGASAPLAAQEAFVEQRQLIELKSAQLRVQEARSAYERKKQLFDQGLIAGAELAQSLSAWQQAQLDFQRVFLGLFSQVPDLAIDSAVKSRTAEGRIQVELTVENRSGAALDYRQLGVDEALVPFPDQLPLRELRQIGVSLKDQEGSSISRPYEHHLDRLPVGARHTFRFDLLKDSETVRVGLKYSGKQEERQLYLEKDPSANQVRISSPQFSLEGELGGEVTYQLRLERFTASVDTFQLTVRDLPPDLEAVFLSGEGGSRLHQIRFGEGETVKNLDLRITLPERTMDGGVLVAAPTQFLVVLEQANLDQGATPAAGPPIGKIQLELVARGIGKLEVLAVNLYQEVFPGDGAEFSIQVRNSGTRRLAGVRVTVQAPADWDSIVEPSSLPELEVDQQSRVRIRLTPPAQAAVGDYPVKIEALASASNRVVQSENKTARLRVVARPDLWGSALVYGLLLALLALLVFVGVKLTRR